MLKGQDVVVLLKLLDPAEPPPVRDLASGLGFDVAGTHRAMRRLGEAGLYSEERRRVHEPHAEEFLLHAVKFSFPAKLGSEAPGVPTSWAADPLKGELADYPGLPVVWPYAMGKVRGLALEPLHPMVTKAALADPELWQRLALVDALRSNDGAVSGSWRRSSWGSRSPSRLWRDDQGRKASLFEGFLGQQMGQHAPQIPADPSGTRSAGNRLKLGST